MRRIPGESRVDIRRHRQFLVRYPNQPHGPLGGAFIHRRHRRHRFALVAHLVHGQDGPVFHSIAVVGIDIV